VQHSSTLRTEKRRENEVTILYSEAQKLKTVSVL